MDLNFIAGAAATVVLFLPVLLILAGRLFANGSLLALSFYYLFTAVYSLATIDIIKLPLLVKQQFAVMLNYLDTPVMLVVLLFFCNEKLKRRMVLIVLGIFICFEIVIGYLFGLDVASSLYLLGPGTLVLLALSIYFFAHYGKVCIVHGKGTGKTFMLVSILFSYGCFLILYYLHYLKHTPAVADVFLLYYIITFISASLMCIGLVWIIKRARAINEVQLARKELALFFDN